MWPDGPSTPHHDPHPPGPGDLPPTPGFHPVVRGAEPAPLVKRALDEIEVHKQTLDDFAKRLEALEGRVAALESRSNA